MKRLFATVGLVFIGLTMTAWPVLADNGVQCTNAGINTCVCTAADCKKPGDSVTGSCTTAVACPGVSSTNSAVPGGAVTGGDSASLKTLPKPLLAIPIPSVSLSDVKNKEGQPITIPWLAEYLQGVYKYAVGLAVILATVMITVGGAQYLLAGDNVGQISAAKNRITDAVLGLMVVLTAYVILVTISPDLTIFKPLTIQTLIRKKVEFVSAAAITRATGSPPVASGQMLKIATEKATEMGGKDFACFVTASMKHESGGKQNAIGHDENATSIKFSVGARRRFQNSGKKWSGATFTPVGCNDKSCQNQGPTNDDSIDLSKPPDYGLDWNYSHGIGSGQSTIMPSNKPCAGKTDQGRGFTMGKNCYSVVDLLDANKQVEAMLNHYMACWKAGGRGKNVNLSYVRYAGTIAEDNPIILSRVAAYNACMGL